MPTLANVQGSSLVADLSGLLRGVEQVGERSREESKLQEIENLALTAQGQSGGQSQSSGPMDFLTKIAPDIAEGISGLVSGRSDPTADVISNIDQTRARAKSNVQVADRILRESDPVKKQRLITEDAERVRRDKGDISSHIKMFNMTPPEQNLQAQKIKMSGQGVIRSLPAPTTNEREIARIKLNVRSPQAAASLRAGTRDRFNMARANRAEQRTIANQARAEKRRVAAEAAPKTQLGQNLAAISRDVQNGALTPELGNILTERAQSAATSTPAPKFQTPLGKLIGDQETVNRTYGADSPQAQAIGSALNSEADGEGPKLTDVAGVRKEFTKLSGDFIAVRDAFGKIQQGNVGDPTGPKDIGMVINFMKMLDPGSVVRETEFDTVRRAQSLPGIIGTFATRMSRGDQIGADQRLELIEAARGIMASSNQTQKKTEQEFRGLATRLKMNPDNVVLDFNPTKQPGEVIDAADFFK